MKQGEQQAFVFSSSVTLLQQQHQLQQDGRRQAEEYADNNNNDDDVFASCADGQDDHVCLHGGTCVPYDDDQYVCDCSQARDKIDDDNHNNGVVGVVQYVGKWCHLPPETYCGGGQDEKNWFCVNGGSCNDNATSSFSCKCQDDFVGTHCEYAKGDVAASTVIIGGGGGDKEEVPQQQQPTTGTAQDATGHPEGSTSSTTPCGPNGVCYHGSTCVRTIQGEYRCDCSITTTTTGSGGDFAGRWCEYEATSYCSDADADQQGQQFFCVNGGTCDSRIDNGRLSFFCSCDDALWTGEMCEVPKESNSEAKSSSHIVDEGCTVTCLNGGECRKGTASETTLSDVDSSSQQESNSQSLEQHYCVCPDGYTGDACEYYYEVCGNGEHYCLHGAKCVKEDQNNNGDMKRHTSSWSCDCSTTFNDDEGAIFSGKHCQSQFTTICRNIDGSSSIYDPTKSVAFCVNDGVCGEIGDTDKGESYPGCVCKPGYTGPHCELLQSPALIAAKQGDLESDSAAILFVCFVFGILFVFLVVVAVLRWRGLRVQQQKSINGRIEQLHRQETSSGQSAGMEEVQFDDEFQDEDLEDVELL